MTAWQQPSALAIITERNGCPFLQSKTDNREREMRKVLPTFLALFALAAFATGADAATKVVMDIDFDNASTYGPYPKRLNNFADSDGSVTFNWNNNDANLASVSPSAVDTSNGAMRWVRTTGHPVQWFTNLYDNYEGKLGTNGGIANGRFTVDFKIVGNNAAANEYMKLNLMDTGDANPPDNGTAKFIEVRIVYQSATQAGVAIHPCEGDTVGAVLASGLGGINSVYQLIIEWDFRGGAGADTCTYRVIEDPYGTPSDLIASATHTYPTQNKDSFNNAGWWRQASGVDMDMHWDNLLIEDLDALPQFTLTPSVSGNGSMTPATATTYNTGTVVTLTATPDPGNVFVNWTGDIAGIGDANAASTTITMDQDRAITGNFVASGLTYTLTNPAVAGGYVNQLDPVSGDPTGLTDYPINSDVQLQAVALPGNIFRAWSGDIGDLDAGLGQDVLNNPVIHLDAALGNRTISPIFASGAATGTGIKKGRLTFSVTNPAVDNPGNPYLLCRLSSTALVEGGGSVAWSYFGFWNTRSENFKLYSSGGSAFTPNANNLVSGVSITNDVEYTMTVEWDIVDETTQTFKYTSIKIAGVEQLTSDIAVVSGTPGAGELQGQALASAAGGIRSFSINSAGNPSGVQIDDFRIEDLTSGSPVVVVDEDFEGMTIGQEPTGNFLEWTWFGNNPDVVIADTAGDQYVSKVNTYGTNGDPTRDMSWFAYSSMGVDDAPGLPVPSFTYVGSSPIIPATVDFTNTSESWPAATAVAWDFDYDGSTFDVDSVENSPQDVDFTTRSRAGTTVALRVTNSQGSAIATEVMAPFTVAGAENWESYK